MERVSFNEGWSVRPKVSAFLERGGQMPSWTPVRLPHDVMIGSARNPSEGPGNAYFPGGTWEYQKKFVSSGGAPGEADVHRVRGCVPRRRGVGERKFRRAPSVWVHGVCSGDRSSGPSR